MKFYIKIVRQKMFFQQIIVFYHIQKRMLQFESFNSVFNQ